ncbi:Clp protease N-terminal domain-containing protein, partial [Micromonospora sp. NPDC049580]|uniref:Clp protease N-terminal domain-containing protein n=1 Tax=Micromonospora sp. NPDC049580 TaxID=3154832 RepID=UPI003424A27A
RAALRQAQRLTQSDRRTDRNLRWTAVDVFLTDRPVRSLDELFNELSVVLVQQGLTPGDHVRFVSQLTRQGWRMLEDGDGAEAKKAFVNAITWINKNVPPSEPTDPQGKIKIRRADQLRWLAIVNAVNGMAAAVAAAPSETLDDDQHEMTSVAVEAAGLLGQPLVQAHLLRSLAIISHRRGDAADRVAGLLRRARDVADHRAHVLADGHHLAVWARHRQNVAQSLWDLVGIDEPEPQRPGGDTAGRLFVRLAADRSETFGVARDRLITPPEPSHQAPPEAVSDPPPIPQAPVSPTPIVNAAPETTSAAAEPVWLASLIAETGGRCWTLALAVETARDLGHRHVGLEHVLLATLSDGGCAYLMTPLGAPLSAVRQTTASWYASGVDPPTEAEPALWPLARSALAVARGVGETRVRPAHLLLALLADTHGSGAAALVRHGVDLEEASARIRADLLDPVRETLLAPLFAAGRAAAAHRLTLPAWLAVGAALDLAADTPAAILDPDHLRAALHTPPAQPNQDRSLVRLGCQARGVLAAARHTADHDGSWGIEVSHLQQATEDDPGPAPPGTTLLTRAASAVARDRRSRWTGPEDIAMAGTDHGRPLADPVPVLTPQARRMLPTHHLARSVE